MASVWEKVLISENDGVEYQAIAPLILSISRATDVSAFFSDWFYEALQNGYLHWRNPFNNQQLTVSFLNVRAIVFWSKFPKPIFPILEELEKRNINYYFLFTLNDYETEGYEPNLPSLAERINIFKELSSKIGKEKVIWRFDPLILSSKISINQLIDKVVGIGNEIHEYTKKLIFSFVQISNYRKVKANFARKSIHYQEFTTENKIEFAEKISEANKNWGLQLATCAEDINLQKFGIEINKCINDNLMQRLFSEDKILMEFLNHKQLKDKGQRENCGCIYSKDIGRYATCQFDCVYCYAK